VDSAPGSIEAIAQLSKAGWTVAVATNQSGIARGYYDLATLDAMHARLRALVAEQGGEVGLIVYCPHGPDEGCDCRKPKPGMLKTIAAHYQVADRRLVRRRQQGDLEAALAVDAQPVLVKDRQGRADSGKRRPGNTLIFDDLAAIAAELI
jgi:D-glycero-D-manno-heptose 1,7-bisphosphate phosphatase